MAVRGAKSAQAMREVRYQWLNFGSLHHVVDPCKRDEEEIHLKATGAMLQLTGHKSTHQTITKSVPRGSVNVTHINLQNRNVGLRHKHILANAYASTCMLTVIQAYFTSSFRHHVPDDGTLQLHIMCLLHKVVLIHCFSLLQKHSSRT